MSFPKAVLFSGKKIVSRASLALQIPRQDVGVTRDHWFDVVLLIWLLDCVSFVQDTGASSEPQFNGKCLWWHTEGGIQLSEPVIPKSLGA